MKRNNKALYESIMRNVSKQVKKALNESLSDKNIAYASSPIESIQTIWKEVRNVLERSEWLYKSINYTLSPHIKPAIVFTFESDFILPDKLSNLIDFDDGYSFSTESGCIVLVLYLDKIDNKYQSDDIQLLLLDFMVNLYKDSTEDITYNVYFGVHSNDSKPLEDEEYQTVIQLMKNQFDDTINMDQGLTCVRTDGESYNKFVNVGNELKKRFE